MYSTLALIASMLLFEATHLDLGIQSLFYDFQMNHWLVDRNNYLLKFIFYDGIKALYLLSIVAIIIGLLFLGNRGWVSENRQGLLIVCASLILVPLLVGILKAVTNVPCPRDLQIFNGVYPYITLTGSYPPGFDQPGNAQCFPAGHASGGFAFMSLFFLFKDKKQRVTALLCAIGVGWAIGSYKTLIGDHFVSHTMISMIFAWMITSIIAHLLTRFPFPRRPGSATSQVQAARLSFDNSSVS